MKNIILITILITSSSSLLAHQGGHGVPLKDWKLNHKEGTFKADFIKYDQNKVWLSNEHHQILEFNMSDFSAKDQKYITDRQKMILSLNAKNTVETSDILFPNPEKWLIVWSILFILLIVWLLKQRRRSYLAYGILCVIGILVVSCSQDESPNITTSNDTSFMRSIFESFSSVSTTFDDSYFYVASNGLPDHNMMVGITNWQQQVPINHNYTGSNSWAIPLHPELTDNPLSTKTNLLKGAIAIAVNGIPIFNPLNNRGEDANTIGELDNWGGHCGRADDYHYHLPPVHLQSSVGLRKPIAYALDGFPVYGETTEPLDEYLGRVNSDGSYQYHTISNYPYFIAGMRGKVSLDPNTIAPENQVTPQATTRGVRSALTPLAGAEITAFQSKETNSYTLTYSLNSASYTINYHWDSNGLYTYEFITPKGTTTNTYQRQ